MYVHHKSQDCPISMSVADNAHTHICHSQLFFCRKYQRVSSRYILCECLCVFRLSTLNKLIVKRTPHILFFPFSFPLVPFTSLFSIFSSTHSYFLSPLHSTSSFSLPPCLLIFPLRCDNFVSCPVRSLPVLVFSFHRLQQICRLVAQHGLICRFH